MEKPDVKIYTINNGWLVEIKSYWEDEPDKIRWIRQAFTYNEEQMEEKAQKSQCEALQKMFYFIKGEGLGEWYQKHNTWNLSIDLEKDGKIVED